MYDGYISLTHTLHVYLQDCEMSLIVRWACPARANRYSGIEEANFIVEALLRLLLASPWMFCTSNSVYASLQSLLYACYQETEKWKVLSTQQCLIHSSTRGIGSRKNVSPPTLACTSPSSVPCPNSIYIYIYIYVYCNLVLYIQHTTLYTKVQG